LIAFEEVFAEWQVVDSRGIFETPMGEGGGIDSVEQVKEDIRKYRPDMIQQVVAASEARALSNHFRVFAEIQCTVTRELGAAIPTVMVLTKVDLLVDPAAWPPADEPEKAAQVKDVLDWVAEVLGARPQRINLNSTLDGYTLAAREYVGMVTVSALPSRRLNVETLADFVGQYLPQSTIPDYAQALQRKELLRRVSSGLTRMFSDPHGF